MTTAGAASASHREPRAQPDRAGLRARPGRPAGRPHRLLRPPGRRRRRGRQGRRHQGREPRQAAPAGADARARQRRREPARDGRGDRAPGATTRRRSSSRIRATRSTTWRWSISWRRRFAGAPGLAERAAALRDALRRRAGAPTAADGRPTRRVLYLIWHEPWMTVARDTYLSRMLARIGWQTLPDAERRLRRRGALSGARAATSRGSARSSGVLLSSEPFAFRTRARRRGAGAVPGGARAARRRRAAQLVRRARRRRAALPARAGRRQWRARRAPDARAGPPPWTSSSR